MVVRSINLKDQIPVGGFFGDFSAKSILDRKCIFTGTVAAGAGDFAILSIWEQLRTECLAILINTPKF